MSAHSAATSLQPRLTEQQVEFFRTEGYLLPGIKLLPDEEFAALQKHFDEKLARLDPTQRPEAMDTPHYTDPALFRWLMAGEVLDLVEQLIGPDIAVFSSHFICKPKGNGKRVPWHEDSNYWKTLLDPMEVVTVWLAIDPSTPANGCMYVIPRTHNTGRKGFSDYEPVDSSKNVFGSEISPTQRNDALAVPCILEPGEFSLHDGRLIHGSPPNTSDIRRCGYTMRYIPASAKFTGGTHCQIYLARGQDRAGNTYADPTKAYPELARFREIHGKAGH